MSPNTTTSGRHQKAVLFPASVAGSTADGTRIVSATPAELDVRWETGKAEALDPQGVPIAVDALVVVDRTITIGGIMWEGALSDLPGTASPIDRWPTSDIMQVITYNKTPDVKGRKFRHVVGLMRLSDTMPTTGT